MAGRSFALAEPGDHASSLRIVTMSAEALIPLNVGVLDAPKHVSKKLKTEGTFGEFDNDAAMRALRRADYSEWLETAKQGWRVLAKRRRVMRSLVKFESMDEHTGSQSLLADLAPGIRTSGLEHPATLTGGDALIGKGPYIGNKRVHEGITRWKLVKPEDIKLGDGLKLQQALLALFKLANKQNGALRSRRQRAMSLLDTACDDDEDDEDVHFDRDDMDDDDEEEEYIEEDEYEEEDDGFDDPKQDSPRAPKDVTAELAHFTREEARTQEAEDAGRRGGQNAGKNDENKQTEALQAVDTAFNEGGGGGGGRWRHDTAFDALAAYGVSGSPVSPSALSINFGLASAPGSGNTWLQAGLSPTSPGAVAAAAAAAAVSAYGSLSSPSGKSRFGPDKPLSLTAEMEAAATGDLNDQRGLTNPSNAPTTTAVAQHDGLFKVPAPKSRSELVNTENDPKLKDALVLARKDWMELTVSEVQVILKGVKTLIGRRRSVPTGKKKAVEDEDEDRNKCIACGRCFDTAQKLEDHMNLHTGNRPFECPVPGCGTTFSNRAMLYKHKKTHSKEFACPAPGCKLVYSNAYDLKRHSVAHSDERPFACKTCGKTFKLENALIAHQRVHTGEKKFMCEHPGCGKKFGYKVDLKRHERTHLGQKAKQKPST